MRKNVLLIILFCLIMGTLFFNGMRIVQLSNTVNSQYCTIAYMSDQDKANEAKIEYLENRLISYDYKDVQYLQAFEKTNIAVSILDARCETLEKNRFFQMP